MAVQTTTPAARPGLGTRIGAFFAGLPQSYDNVRAEMRKVTWPDLAQIRQATIGIIAVVLFVGAIIALMDVVLQQVLVRWIPSFFTGR
ncbi:MAG TPA: preprotein translocase subunit SecE [Gemmatimonadaceae bacterium]|nr:preprotein translocase subunit SecE [Gemmatimonadaceae bacterium]